MGPDGAAQPVDGTQRLLSVPSPPSRGPDVSSQARGGARASRAGQPLPPRSPRLPPGGQLSAVGAASSLSAQKVRAQQTDPVPAVGPHAAWPCLGPAAVAWSHRHWGFLETESPTLHVPTPLCRHQVKVRSVWSRGALDLGLAHGCGSAPCSVRQPRRAAQGTWRRPRPRRPGQPPCRPPRRTPTWTVSASC